MHIAVYNGARVGTRNTTNQRSRIMSNVAEWTKYAHAEIDQIANAATRIGETSDFNFFISANMITKDSVKYHADKACRGLSIVLSAILDGDTTDVDLAHREVMDCIL